MSFDNVDVKITSHNMPESMQDEVVTSAVMILMESTPVNTFPTKMKEYMDAHYKPSWHCVMGKNYCSHVSFVKGNFITFVVEGHTVLLFRTA
ncbi:hypothetical protein FBUS_09407 [Fasciolopsis buskii]|uniref:Dynein light chain n=1 Tax=Fasciolopsis buskii TaxID=27845 RepID=A0A8E0S083_9TREM|nr:hypothetical protein FBUS_09407 [Fasciolopsis buski]